jgi:hypothetical protein
MSARQTEKEGQFFLTNLAKHQAPGNFVVVYKLLPKKTLMTLNSTLAESFALFSVPLASCK